MTHYDFVAVFFFFILNQLFCFTNTINTSAEPGLNSFRLFHTTPANFFIKHLETFWLLSVLLYVFIHAICISFWLELSGPFYIYIRISVSIASIGGVTIQLAQDSIYTSILGPWCAFCTKGEKKKSYFFILLINFLLIIFYIQTHSGVFDIKWI